MPAEVILLDYGLKDKAAIITGTNNPQGIGAATAFAFAREGAKLILVYQKIARDYDDSKTGENGADRYYRANAADPHGAADPAGGHRRRDPLPRRRQGRNDHGPGHQGLRRACSLERNEKHNA